MALGGTSTRQLTKRVPFAGIVEFPAQGESHDVFSDEVKAVQSISISNGSITFVLIFLL